MAVVVVHPGADGREPRPQPFEERGARGPGAAVVGDLEHVPAAAISRQGREQVVVAIRLEVPGQQDPLAAEADREHDRGVVDGPSRRGRHGR
jgi:hypothetical protein